jgi:hypothetical protein
MNYKLAFFAEKLINNNKLKYILSKDKYFYDIKNQFPDDISIQEIISYFQSRFTDNKISYKTNILSKSGILIEKLRY